MKCVRCAKRAEGNNVFCNECLKDMERHPVKSGTPVQLPNRENRIPAKRASFRVAESKWQDRIFRLKCVISLLICLVILLAAALMICACAIYGILPHWIAKFFGLADLKPI